MIIYIPKTGKKRKHRGRKGKVQRLNANAIPSNEIAERIRIEKEKRKLFGNLC
jgi:hypothetical protein